MNSLQLEHDSFGRLVLTLADGGRHVGVVPVRAFPISDPGRGLSLCDGHGRELAWIDDPAQLAPAVKSLLDKELAQREFVPQIHRIDRVSRHTDPSEWEVQTDRGPTKFLLKSEEDVRRLENHRALITDAHGIRYLIADTRAVDAGSRRILERYL